MILPPVTVDQAVGGFKIAASAIPVLGALRKALGQQPDDPSLREFINRTMNAVVTDVDAARHAIIELRELLLSRGIPQDRSLRQVMDDYGLMSRLFHLPTWRLLQRAGRILGTTCVSLESDVGDAITLLACMNRQEEIFVATREGDEQARVLIGDLAETKMDRPVGEVLHRLIDTANALLQELPRV